MIVCSVVSLVTPPPRPEQVNDDMTINWQRLNIFGGLGEHWYTSVLLWWGIFAAIVLTLFVIFSGLFS